MKSCQPNVNKLFLKTFHKNLYKRCSSQTWQMKSIPKTNIPFNFYYLPTSTVLSRKGNTTIYKYWNNSPDFSCFFSNFLSFHSCVFIFFVFCILSKNGSSHLKCSVKKGVLRNFEKFTGKHLCQSLLFNKVAGFSFSLLKKRLWCFLVNFAKFLGTSFIQNIYGRLVL